MSAEGNSASEKTDVPGIGYLLLVLSILDSMKRGIKEKQKVLKATYRRQTLYCSFGSSILGEEVDSSRPSQDTPQREWPNLVNAHFGNLVLCHSNPHSTCQMDNPCKCIAHGIDNKR